MAARLQPLDQIPFDVEKNAMGSQLDALNQWVMDVARLTQPDRIQWCDGSDSEFDALVAQMEADGTLVPLNPQTHPRSWLHRSHPEDVARVEHLTFVCTSERDDAGPNNHWMAPADAHEKMDALFAGCMRGRTMYVIPYCMGPIASPLARCGVEITDSPYVVANMRIMTRMGAAALGAHRARGSFVRGLHSIGELDPERRFIMHFPEELTIQSFGSGYGGNALLGKKCHALRIASHQAREEGWLAEHMLILGLENPQGETHYIAAAFPSACGKTNLAMLIPPEGYRAEGWKVWTVGDDICWMRPGADGRLYAINPEAGFFGVAPGTSRKSNPNALSTIQHDTIFTNVGLTADNEPWWEGLDNRVPAFDWRGNAYDCNKGPAAHPNARFTVSAKQCPSYSPQAEDAQGVPIRRSCSAAPRVAGAAGVRSARLDARRAGRRGDGFGNDRRRHRRGRRDAPRSDGDEAVLRLQLRRLLRALAVVRQAGAKLPKIFHVNWFRKGDDGKFLWPGFGDNLRVLEWMIQPRQRRRGRGGNADRRHSASRSRQSRRRAAVRGSQGETVRIRRRGLASRSSKAWEISCPNSAKGRRKP
jgi:phosphoenolpyruvate carboxykinase (GTP)